MNIKRAKHNEKSEIVKLQFQPRFSSTHTITVAVITPPMHSEKKNQLKNDDMALWLLGSNWSAPWAGRTALTPPTPIAIA